RKAAITFRSGYNSLAPSASRRGTTAIIPDFLSPRTNLRANCRGAGLKDLRDCFGRKSFHVAQNDRRAFFIRQRGDGLRNEFAPLCRQEDLLNILLRSRNLQHTPFRVSCNRHNSIVVMSSLLENVPTNIDRDAINPGKEI